MVLLENTRACTRSVIFVPDLILIYQLGKVALSAIMVECVDVGLTKFGVAVRKVRLDKLMMLSDMASKMDVTPAYISSVEFGRKPITNKYVERVIEALEANDIEAIEIHRAADLSRKEYQIDAANMSDDARLVAGQFARKLEQMDPQKLKQLRELLGD